MYKKVKAFQLQTNQLVDIENEQYYALGVLHDSYVLFQSIDGTKLLTLDLNDEVLAYERIRGFEPVSYVTEEVILPLRATKTSAGYDFYTTYDLKIRPQQKVFFWTNVKSYMNNDEVLLLDVRSSIGAKHDLMLANTIGVIDSDYYNNPDNEGNIGICLRNLKPSMELVGYEKVVIDGKEINIPVINDLTEENTVNIKAGDRVAQGIFLKYLKADNCNSENERIGGYGSTEVKK